MDNTSIFSLTRDLITFVIRSSSSFGERERREEGGGKEGRKERRRGGKEGGKEGGRREGGRKGGKEKRRHKRKWGKGLTFKNIDSYSICETCLHVFIHLLPEDSDAIILILNISNFLLNLQHRHIITQKLFQVQLVYQQRSHEGSLADVHTTRKGSS